MVRFGIVGFGLHAAKRLMPGFAMAQHARPVALTRRKLDDARATAKQWQIEHAFDSVDALCASSQVDAVFVTSPDSLHLEHVLTAIRHRKPVLVEKPMAMNGHEARQMVKAANDAGVPLGVAHVFRFASTVERLRECVLSGDLGRPTHARAEFCYPGHTSARGWMDTPGVACGGPLADVGVHCVDTLRHILSNQGAVERVCADTARSGSQLETAATAQLRFASGVMAMVAVSSRAAYRTIVEVVGASGSVGGHNLLTIEAPVCVELRRGMSDPEVEQLTNHDAYARQVDAFAASLRGGDPFAAPGIEGLRNQLILDALYRSAASGRWEQVETA